MNRKHLYTIGAGSVVLAFTALSVAGPTLKDSKTQSALGDRSALRMPGQQSSVPIIETTGFETPDWDAYTPGQSNFFCGAAYWATCTATPIAASCTGNPVADKNCCIGAPNALNGWFASGSSQHCREPHIEIAHPATGSQHLRFVRDPQGGNPAGTTGLGTATRVNAFTPDTGAQPVGRTVVDFDISGNAFGQNFLYFSVGTDNGTGTYIYFYAGGNMYIADFGAGTLNDGGPYTDDGNYHHVKVDKNVCADTMVWTYDGATIYSTVASSETGSLERAILESDNGPGIWDIDNYSVQRFGPCPVVCGDNNLQPGEQCEPGLPGSGNCPAGRCVAAGQPGECTCSPICTLANPCPVRNGPNGPFLGPCDTGASVGCWFTYTGNSPAVEADFCGTTGAGLDTFIDIYDAVAGGAPLATNDDCENADSFGAGSSPNASCFNNVGAPNYESCTCATSPSGQYMIREQTAAAPGSSVIVNVNKKTQCGGAVIGSCCITNGPAFGCSDNVAQAACTGTWSNKKCVDVTCACIPNCNGRVCGPDGCGGTCAPNNCSDGNACNGVETCNDSTGQCVPGQPVNCSDGLVCNGVETCVPATGACAPGTPLNCDDQNACTIDSCAEPNGCAHAPRSCDDGLACNGVETCNPASGCVAGTPIDCDDGVDCTVDACDETVDGNCTHDDSHCFTPIPTVSQWGVAVMALLLLIGAKIYFTRRQSASA